MGETARTWQGLLQHVVEANGDLVSSKRLKGHLETYSEKKPALKMVGILDGRVELREGFPEDDGGLETVATVLGILYWIMVDMHTEPAAAAERLRRPVQEYAGRNLADGGLLGLDRFLPALNLEGTGGPGPAGPAPPPAGEPSPGAPAAAVEAGPGQRPEPAAPEAGDHRELWERSMDGTPEGGAEGGGAGSAVAAGGAAAARYDGAVSWLGEDIPRGCSLLVEGAGGAKEAASIRFIGEGLASGESVLALLASRPESFREKLRALGYDPGPAESAGRLRILDWATFRDRHVADLEDDGHVMILPGELTSVNPAVNMGLADLPDSPAPRAYIDILPRALATVAIETVFNFVQVTILKLRRRRMTGLFIMEEEKDPEKSAIRLSFNSWLEVAESEDGKYNVRLGGPILPSKLKTLSWSDGRWQVDREEALAPPRAPAPEPAVPPELRSAVEEWRSQGYDVSALEEQLAGDPVSARNAIERFGADVERLRVIRDDLRILDLAGFESDAASIHDMLHDVGRAGQAVRAHAQLRQKLDRRRAGAKAKGGAAPPVGAPAPAGPSAPPEGREPESPRAAPEPPRRRDEADRRAREPAGGEERLREFRETVDRWRKDGLEVGHLEEALAAEPPDLEHIRKDILLFRVQIPRLRELGEELAAMDAPALGKRKSEIAAMLRDPNRMSDIDKGMERLRAEWAAIREAERARREEDGRRRAALSEKLFWWSSHGLPVERLEEALGADAVEAERAFSAYEPAARRLLSLKEKLMAMDTSGFEEEVARLEPVLNDVGDPDRAEAAFADFARQVERGSREALERKALSEQLAAWTARGFRTEAVARSIQGEPGAARRELELFEERARAAEALSAQLAAMDTKGYEGRIARLRELLSDPARLEECRGLHAAIRADQERARAEALERGEYRRRIEEWRRSGLPTGQVEGLLDKELSALRRAVLSFQFDVDFYDDLLAQLEPLLRSRQAEEAARLQKELRDFGRLSELEGKVAALRAAAEAEAAASAGDLSRDFAADVALMEKLRGWVAGGMAVRRLEGALRHERESWRSEMDRLEREIEELSKESSALEVLDAKGHESDLEHVRSMLNDPDNLPLVRAYRDALRTRIARRKKEGERKAALAAVARDWEQKGLRVRQLHEALKGDLEGASAQFVLFRARLAAAEHLRRRLDALELFGGDPELDRLRRRLDDSENPADLAPEVERLWKAAEEKGRERAARRKAARERKRALRERMTAWLEKGLSVRRLERALELPPDEAERELARFEEDAVRLSALGARLEAMEAPSLEPELSALRSRLDDVDAVAEIERGIAALEERAELARREERSRQEAERARLDEEVRRAALRRRLEERLREWAGLGLNVEPLRPALAGETGAAEKKFAEFETALARCQEIRSRLSGLQAESPDGVPGAEAVEKLLRDPLNLAPAEHAFEECSRKAEAARSAAGAEMERIRERIRDLASKGEDVSALERAAAKGLREARPALAEFEKSLVTRERMETWRGIKSRLLSPSPPAGPGAEPQAEPDGTAERTEEPPGPAADGAAAEGSAPSGTAKKKVRKVRK